MPEIPADPTPHSLRVTVYFDGDQPGEELSVEYSASTKEAWEYASAAINAGLTVTIDNMVRPGLRPLPSRSLWP